MKNFFKEIIRSIGYNFHKNSIEDFHSYNPIEAFKRDEIKSSYQYFKDFFYSSVLLSTVDSIRSFAIKKSLENSNNENQDELFLEFGVHRGKSTNFFANHLKENDKKIYGFDSFQGQPNDWPGYIRLKGYQKLNKKNMDKLNSNIEIIDGLVEDTLETFLLNNERKKILFAHMDLDYYPSTLFVLKKIKPYLSNNAIILFHALHNYSGWKNGVIKAINETFSKNEFEFIAFSSKIQGVIKYKKN
jgi:hypothetical protein